MGDDSTLLADLPSADRPRGREDFALQRHDGESRPLPHQRAAQVVALHDKQIAHHVRQRRLPGGVNVDQVHAPAHDPLCGQIESVVPVARPAALQREVGHAPRRAALLQEGDPLLGLLQRVDQEPEPAAAQVRIQGKGDVHGTGEDFGRHLRPGFHAAQAGCGEQNTDRLGVRRLRAVPQGVQLGLQPGAFPLHLLEARRLLRTGGINGRVFVQQAGVLCLKFFKLKDQGLARLGPPPGFLMKTL